VLVVSYLSARLWVCVWGKRAVIRIFALALGVLLATTAPAVAQTRADAPKQSAAPWYERFTFGAETQESTTRWVPRSDNRVVAPLSPRSRWGLSMSVTPQQTQRPLAGDQSRVSAGAYYQLSPRVSVGGAVNLPSAPTEARKKDDKTDGPAVRFESAFRF
jgi:hypothetical protein